MYIICLTIIFIFALFFSIIGAKEKNRYFIILTGLVLFLYAALRSPLLGNDTSWYFEEYIRISKFNYQEAITLYRDNSKDPTYYFSGWLFSRIFIDGQWWLAFISGLYLFFVCFIIYKESENCFLSIIAFLSLSFFSFSFTGLRQTVAMAITIWAFFFIKKKRPILFFLTVLIASLFHISALVFLIIYPIARHDLGLFHILAFLGCVVLFIGFESSIRRLIEIYLSDTQIGGYSDNEEVWTFSGFIIQATIFVFCLFYYKNAKNKYNNANIYYNFSFVGLCFQLFAAMIAEFFRVSMYFSFFNIILIPMAISCEPNKKLRGIESFVIATIFILYMFIDGIPQYSFFWN